MSASGCQGQRALLCLSVLCGLTGECLKQVNARPACCSFKDHCMNMVFLTRHCQGRAAQDFLEGGKAFSAFCSVAADSACCRRRSVSASMNSHTSAAERDVASCIQRWGLNRHLRQAAMMDVLVRHKLRCTQHTVCHGIATCVSM